MSATPTPSLVELAQDVQDKTKAHLDAIAAKNAASAESLSAAAALVAAQGVEDAARKALSDAVTKSLSATSAFEPTDPTPPTPAPSPVLAIDPETAVAGSK